MERRQVLPLFRSAFTSDENDDVAIEFTIDKDSLVVTLNEPATKRDQAVEEVISIIGPRFSDFEIEATRIGDFRVTVPLEGYEIGDIGWLERMIDEAEEDGLDVYDVKVNTA